MINSSVALFGVGGTIALLVAGYAVYRWLLGKARTEAEEECKRRIAKAVKECEDAYRDSPTDINDVIDEL